LGGSEFVRAVARDHLGSPYHGPLRHAASGRPVFTHSSPHNLPERPPLFRFRPKAGHTDGVCSIARCEMRSCVRYMEIEAAGIDGRS